MTQISSSHSDSSVCVRPATDADRASLMPLINAAYSVERFLEGERTDEAQLAAMMRKGVILVAESGGQLLGCVYTEVRGRRGYLGLLAVDPAQQGKRLSCRLVTEAEEHLRRQGCEAADMIVLSLRSELLPVYHRFGYVETGTKEFGIGRQLKPGAVCHEIMLSKALLDSVLNGAQRV